MECVNSLIIPEFDSREHTRQHGTSASVANAILR